MPKYENSSAEKISADLWGKKLEETKKGRQQIEHKHAYFVGCAQTAILGQRI